MAASYFPDRIKSPGANGTQAASPNPLSPPATAPRSTAIQSRVTNVLSASYADLEIRDALSVLDERKTANTAETRRNLRLDVQQELIQCNGEIVQDFGAVAAQLKRIGKVIADLNTSCAEMRKHITASNREAGPMLEEAGSILKDRQQIETKQQLLDAFKAHFVVSDTDLASLSSTVEPVNDDFFRVLTRVKRIHEDSQVLLGSENQRLGLEILEQSSKQLNAAFQKLYRWVQREFKTLDLENPQISTAIRRALRVLAERPALFQNCLDFFAEARERILSDNFYAALTGAPVDPNHPVMGKAIELSAHEPLRYVGDMLAWAHSATVSEREALEVLFISEGDEIAKSIQAGIESEPWTRDSDEDAQPVFDGRKALNELVDRDLSGVFRQLKQRIEQVIQSHEDAVLAYKISNLVTFYDGIFTSLLGSQSSLLNVLRPIADTALRSFRLVIRDNIESLRAETSITPTEFAPPDFLLEALNTIQTLMQSHETSSGPMSRSERAEAFEPIMREALDPYLSACANLTNRLNPPNSHIFALNYLLTIKDVLSKNGFAARANSLQPQIKDHAQDLTDDMHDWLLAQSGLKTLVDSISNTDHLSSTYKDPAQLAKIAANLDAFLPTATEDAREWLKELQDKTLVRRVCENAAERFCEDFEEIEGLIVQADEVRERAEDDDEGEDGAGSLRNVFPRTGDEIRVLLS
ncbi:hypothetical protein MBLNU230_g0806t1 [Neophaeotheca triangularis]